MLTIRQDDRYFMAQEKDLDFASVILALAVLPIEQNIMSSTISMADYDSHVYHGSIYNGSGVINSGPLVTMYTENEGSQSEVQEELKNELKSRIESVCDITVKEFTLQAVRQDEKLVLTGCSGSKYTANSEYSEDTIMFPLLLAKEASRVPIFGQCITKGRRCETETTRISREEVISRNVRRMAFKRFEDYDQATAYFISRFWDLLPSVMESEVSICNPCLKLCRRSESRAQSRISTRPITRGTSRAPSRAGSPVKDTLPKKRVAVTARSTSSAGNRFKFVNGAFVNGLYVTQDYSTHTVNEANTIYRQIIPMRPILAPLRTKPPKYMREQNIVKH